MLDDNTRAAMQVLAAAGRVKTVRAAGGVPVAEVRLPAGSLAELREIVDTAAGKPARVWECELAYPMYGADVHEREPFGVEKIRELAFPVLVCRFEDVSLAAAERRRHEINDELGPMGWPKLGELYEVRREEAIR